MGVTGRTRAPSVSAGTDDARFPRAIPLFVGALGLLAVGGSVVAAMSPSAHEPFRLPIATAFGVLLAVAASTVLMFQHRQHRMALDLFETVMLPAAFLLPPIPLIAAVVVAQIVANVRRRNHPVKGAFNVAQWAATAVTASLVIGGLRDGTGFSVRNVTALSVAAVAAALVNTLAFTTVIRLASGKPMARSIPGMLPSLVAGWVVNTAFALLLVAAYRPHVASMALFAVPLVVAHWSNRSYAAALADKARLAGLHEATRALAAPVDPRDALPAFLAAVRRCFDAEVAELVLLHDGGRTIHRSSSAGEDDWDTTIETLDVRSLSSLLLECATTAPVRVHAGTEPLAQRLQDAGHRDCIAAPMVSEGDVSGILCVYDVSGPAGFEDGEEAVLAALAAEAAGALRKGALLGAIIEERRKLSEIVEQTSDGMFTLAPDGTILLWNPALERISGFSADEMVGARGLERLRMRDGDGADLDWQAWVAADEPLALTLVEISTREGQSRWLSCSSTTARGADGRTTAMIVVARDITRAREVERLKDDFVATVSHELRTPLTPIKGWALTLLNAGDRMTADERASAARSILHQAQHLEQLVTGMLEVARIEEGITERRDGIADVCTVVERVTSQIRTAHPMREIALVTLTREKARGDELFIERIVSNLMLNAIKYAPEDEPIVVTLARDASGILVSVADHGPGIHRDEVERIFDRFHRLGDVMTRTTGGAGLGLYIARELAREIDATLTVASEPGAGSTFTLRLRPARALSAAG